MLQEGLPLGNALTLREKHSEQHSYEFWWGKVHQLKTLLRMSCSPNGFFSFVGSI